MFMHLRERLGERTYDLSLIGIITLVAFLSFALGWHAAERVAEPTPIVIELVDR